MSFRVRAKDAEVALFPAVHHMAKT